MEQFQFPSNGKVYSEVHSFCLGERRWVSIPFKRESVFRASKEVLTTKNEIKVSIPFKRESVFREKMKVARQALRPRVSIPFKRESVFRVMGVEIDLSAVPPSFQFPSNGKVYSEAW